MKTHEYDRRFNRRAWQPFAMVLDPEEIESFRLVTGVNGMFFATVAERTTDAIRHMDVRHG